MQIVSSGCDSIGTMTRNLVPIIPVNIVSISLQKCNRVSHHLSHLCQQERRVAIHGVHLTGAGNESHCVAKPQGTHPVVCPQFYHAPRFEVPEQLLQHYNIIGSLHDLHAPIVSGRYVLDTLLEPILCMYWNQFM